MKIKTVEQFRPRPRCQLVKITTDTGLEGWGETTLEGKLDSARAAVDEVVDYLLGQDPLRIEHHWQYLYRGAFLRSGIVMMTALSGIEQALWDIAGKHFGVPVYQLLGGATRDRIKVYAWWTIRDDLEETRQEVEDLLKRGYRAFKSGPDEKWHAHETPAYMDRFIKAAYQMREWAGPDVDIAYDFHGKMNSSLAIELCRELEGMRPMFVEEPVPQENVDALALVARSTRIPIATGERLLTRWEFRQVIEKQAAAFLQPDVSHTGGIFETRKIAAMAETYYMHIAPHGAIGAVNFAANLQLDACIPNFLIQEQGDWSLGDGVLVQDWEVKNGYIELPQKPGLGMEVDEVEARKWYTGEFRKWSWLHDDDGSVADY